MEASNTFRKRVIIVVRKETVTIVARTFKKNSAASFNRKKKYIQINNDATAFA